MTIAYRTGAQVNGNTNSIQITIPSGVQVGDLILVQISQNNTEAIISAPGALNLLDNNTTASSNFPNRLYYGVINGTTLAAGTVLTWALSAVRAWSAVLYAASGVDTSNPILALQKAADITPSVVMPSYIPTSAAWLVEIGSAKSNGTTITDWTAPAGWTSRQEAPAYSSFSGSAIAADMAAQVSPGGGSGAAVVGAVVDSLSANNDTNTSLAVTLATTTPGELNIIDISGYAAGTTVDPNMATPAGWTKLFGAKHTSGTPDTWAGVFYRKFQNGDPSSVTFTWTAAGKMIAKCTAWSSQDGTTPVPYSVSAPKAASDINYSISGTTTAQGFLCYGFANKSASTSTANWASLTDNARGSAIYISPTTTSASMVCRVTAAEVTSGTAFTKAATGANTSVGMQWAYVVKGGTAQSYGGETYTTNGVLNIAERYLVALAVAATVTIYDRYALVNGNWVGIDTFALVGGSWV